MGAWWKKKKEPKSISAFPDGVKPGTPEWDKMTDGLAKDYLRQQLFIPENPRVEGMSREDALKELRDLEKGVHGPTSRECEKKLRLDYEIEQERKKSSEEYRSKQPG